MKKQISSISLLILVATAIWTPLALGADENAGELLYNGIRLPAEWPPQVEQLSLEPMPVPYLEHPPAVIPIDVGRQLFVDDFLIERTTLKRSFHQPRYYSNNPVLKPDKTWESEAHGPRQGPAAMPFSDGVWYDPQDKLFKIWYFADYGSKHICYATSHDGIHWEKPSLDVVPGTNIVLTKPRDANVVWLDLEETNPQRRFKMVITSLSDDIIGPNQKWWGSKCVMDILFSPDGIHWSEPVATSGPAGDRNSAFYNPFRKLWVFSIREYSPLVGFNVSMRTRRYWESPDLIANLPWKYAEPTMWVGADRLDFNSKQGDPVAELYTLDAVAYESIMVGLFTIYRDCADMEQRRPKINEICVGFSRDGFHWDRPNRRSFLPVSEDKQAWNWGNMQSAGGCFLVVGDQLYFYASGRKGDAPHHPEAGCSTGLAMLRRDGFASMDTSEQEGELITRPLRFGGKHLFVNADVRNDGELLVEVLDKDNKPIAPFTRENCVPINVDKTLVPVCWKNAMDMAGLAGKAVKFRFIMKQGSLYSFWVSPDESGASHGYVAAGGPGFTGPSDTVGTSGCTKYKEGNTRPK